MFFFFFLKRLVPGMRTSLPKFASSYPLSGELARLASTSGNTQPLKRCRSIHRMLWILEGRSQCIPAIPFADDWLGGITFFNECTTFYLRTEQCWEYVLEADREEC